MNVPSQAGPEPLSFDRLRRLQASLTRRVVHRDTENIQQVGFAPQRTDRPVIVSEPSLAVTAQFDVTRKLQHVPSEQSVAPVETVRLLDRRSRNYLQFGLQTDVLPTGNVVPTGVRVENGAEFATASAVVRWTKIAPASAIDTIEQAQAPGWRWGVLCVAHLFTKRSAATTAQARVERQISCGVGPASVQGDVVARGRVPGGPDISLIETGLDRLWLSGLLSRPNAPKLIPASEPQLLDWISNGTEGTFLGDGVTHAWQWQTFYPELHIASLGRLRHIVRYQASDNANNHHPFGPGSSGGVLVAGGIPIGLQIAAINPAFQVGFAQSFDVSLQWLKNRLRATALHIVHLIME